MSVCMKAIERNAQVKLHRLVRTRSQQTQHVTWANDQSGALACLLVVDGDWPLGRHHIIQ